MKFHLFSIIQENYENYGNAASIRKIFDGSFTFNDCLIAMIIAKHIGKRTPLDVTPEDDAIIFHKVTSQPIANILRGKMDADEFRDYILGFIFYNYLIGKMRMYAGEIASLSSFNKKHIFG